jgi:hypothetical protein
MARTAVHVATALLLTLGAAVQADTLLVEGLRSDKVAAAEWPARGQSMSIVESRWGAPSGRGDAVGQPPISRWDYPAFIVFFEHQHVIHTVARR